MPTQKRVAGDQGTIGLLDGAGKHATLISNISVARMVKRIVSSTLGPLGMSRILLKKTNEDRDEIVLTSDGGLVLESMRMEHPVGKLLATLAKSQKDESGDGATTAVILACSLLENAEELVEMGLHPSSIIEGYRIAKERAVETLEQSLSTAIDTSDDGIMRSIVRSVMNSRILTASADILELFTGFVVKIANKMFGASWRKGPVAPTSLNSLDNISIVKKSGESLVESQLMLDGFLIDDREVVHPNMPHKVDNASIALIKSLETKRLPPRTGTSPLETMKVAAGSLSEYREYMQGRLELAKTMVGELADAGANVALVSMGIDELVEHYLSRKTIMAIKRIKSRDTELIAKLTQGTVVSSAEELSPGKLGRAVSVEEVSFSSDDHCILIKGGGGEGTASVVLRGSSKQVLDEAERILKTALRVADAVTRDARIVLGGGATEMELAKNLDSYALSFSGKEQFAIQRYARSLEAIPRILSQNAGMNPVEAITDLRKAHNKGLSSWGVDAPESKIADMREAKVFDLARTKLNGIEVATELATSVLRISGIEKARRAVKIGAKVKEAGETEMEGGERGDDADHL